LKLKLRRKNYVWKKLKGKKRNKKNSMPTSLSKKKLLSRKKMKPSKIKTIDSF